MGDPGQVRCGFAGDTAAVLPALTLPGLHVPFTPFPKDRLEIPAERWISKQMEANLVQLRSGLHQLLLKNLPRASESKMICIIYAAFPLFSPSDLVNLSVLQM